MAVGVGIAGFSGSGVSPGLRCRVKSQKSVSSPRSGPVEAVEKRLKATLPLASSLRPMPNLSGFVGQILLVRQAIGKLGIEEH